MERYFIKNELIKIYKINFFFNVLNLIKGNNMKKTLFLTSMLCYFMHVNIFALDQISTYDNNKTYQGILAVTVSKSGTCLLDVILENLLGVNNIGPTANYSKEQLEGLISCNKPYFFHPIEENSYWYVFNYPDAKKILTIRDPRDIVVSLTDFIDKVGTGIWPQLRLENVDWKKYTRKEKIKAILKTNHLVISFDRIDEIIAKCDKTYVWKFETFVTEKSCNIKAILDIAEFLEIPISYNDASLIAQNSYGSNKSRTFFKGISGRWKEEFDEEIKALFKQNPLNKYLLRWGYEENNEW